MKKGKRTLSLAMSLLAITSLTGCNEDYKYPDTKWKDGLIVNVGGKDYTYEEIYKLLDNTKGSAQAYYNVAKNVLAQLVTPRTDPILSTVDAKINDLKSTWKTNARTNRTSTKEEMEKTFDSENVDDIDELREKYIAEEQNTQNSNAFYDINKDGTTDSTYKFYISEQMTKDYVTKQAPFHVSHILIKVDASSDGQGYWNGKISADDARQIGNVTGMLASSNSFGSVAQIASDDTGSAKLYGELYTSTDGSTQIAMEKTTSYINEFKLGLYAYEAYLNPETQATGINTSVRASLRVPGEAAKTADFNYTDETAVADTINNTYVGKRKAFGIPLSKAITMGYIADVEKNVVNGSKVDFASDTQYPRNIIFNNYFNYHGVNFIYDDSADYEAEFLDSCQGVAKAAGISETITLANLEEKLPAKYAEYEYVTGQLAAIDANKFQTVAGISDNLVNYKGAIAGSKKILVEKDDGTKNPIIVVRGGSSSYQGIHFIVVNNDPFIGADTKYQYYRTNIPSTTAEATSANTTDYSQNPSFINFVNGDYNTNTTFNTRRDTITKVIKASDSNIEFRLWDENVKKFNSECKTKYQNVNSFDDILGDYADVIAKYIDTTREGTVNSAEESLDSSWETYIQQLALQQEVAPRGIVPEVCVSAFEGGSFNGKESLCHVEK